jgi:serpin B
MVKSTRPRAIGLVQGLLILALLVGPVLGGCGPAATSIPTPAPESDEPAPVPTAPESDDPTPVPTAPEEEPGGEEAMDFGPVFARDAALAYLAATYGQRAPALDLAWTEKDTTPTNIVGGSSVEYRAGNWVLTVQYPIVLPENTIYQVTADDGSGFHWEGEVNAGGEVRELVLPGAGAQAQPAAGQAGGEDLPALVEGNSLFALDLYQALREQEGNLFYSPYSISAALAMTYAGARGQTEAQMAQALHFALPQETLHGSFALLAGELASRGEGAEGKDGEGFRLHVANALWLQHDFDLLADYLALVEAAYGAAPHPVDFQGAPEEARVTINDWVAGETEDRITDLIPPGVIDALTRLVLTNAIYFNAAWALPFEKDATSDGPFTLLDGEQISVPMMRQNGALRYAAGEGYQAVELFYDGGELSMVILLPQAGQFEAFEGSLDAARLAEIEAGLSRQQVTLSMPRFEFESQFSLSESLAALGMEDAFTSAADFSGITGSPDLFISEVLHKAFVSVDEEGTEAAAATAVVMGLTAAPAEVVQMAVDRPFVFFIRDVNTGAVLFLGRVVDPSQ